jgi:hypothetical protein
VPRRVIPIAATPHPLDFRAWAEGEFRAAFVRLVSRVGSESAWDIYKKLGKRPRGRPPGPRHPERDDELLRLVDALNKPNPTPIAQAAQLINDAFPQHYGATPKAIETTIHRRRGQNV